MSSESSAFTSPGAHEIEDLAKDVAEPSLPEGRVRAGASMRRFAERWLPVERPGALGRLFGASGLPRESAGDYREAVAELDVADTVGGLGEGWWVGHGVSMCGDAGAASRDDISHVVIGDRGVFAVAAVNPSGESVWVSSNAFVRDGVRMAHLRDAEYNALRLSQQLYESSGVRVEVVPAVVVANPRRLIIDRPPLRVAVVRPREFAGWIRSHPLTLDAAERVTLVAASDRLIHNSPSGFDQVLAQFRELHGRVLNARRRRIWWIAIALFALWIGLIAIVAINQVG